MNDNHNETTILKLTPETEQKIMDAIMDTLIFGQGVLCLNEDDKILELTND